MRSSNSFTPFKLMRLLFLVGLLLVIASAPVWFASGSVTAVMFLALFGLLLVSVSLGLTLVQVVRSQQPALVKDDISQSKAHTAIDLSEALLYLIFWRN